MFGVAAEGKGFQGLPIWGQLKLIHKEAIGERRM